MSGQTTLGFKKSISRRNSVMERKVPDFVRQGRLSVITAVNSLLTSKGYLYMRKVFIELSLALNILL